MAELIETLLLLALPAAGKSELRRYLAGLTPSVAARDFHLGPTVQLDDYPYVHFMRRIAQELKAGADVPTFFDDDNTPFAEPRDWGTLIHLLNDDYAILGRTPKQPESAARWLFDRLDTARSAVGAVPALGQLDTPVRDRLASALEPEAAALWAWLAETVSSWSVGDTVVIEFARGGPDGEAVPLAAPYGYGYALSELSAAILERSSILYVWVTPEESRRRNRERARPGRDGDASILHHGVPEAVMLGEYGSDDLPWLIEQGGGDSVVVETEGGPRKIPAAMFDNRIDHTSFLRADPDEWPAADVGVLHTELRSAFDRLAGS